MVYVLIAGQAYSAKYAYLQAQDRTKMGQHRAKLGSKRAPERIRRREGGGARDPQFGGPPDDPPDDTG
eukprot:6111072-Karenia_brevis.AAC.1